MVTPVVRLTRKLGAGGMGSIWLADHLTLHAPVVVKFMARDLVQSDEARSRFAREASAAAQLRSPHVVQVLDHGVTERGVPYIVMEHLEGRDLASLIDARGKLEPKEVEHVLGQVVKALTKAHAQGIVHRDIKPENIFLSGEANEEPFVKLLDFGIAKAKTGREVGSISTQTGAILGTPFYMSPEQIASGKNVDHRSDVWALGVVVFQALTGRRPFLADDYGELVLILHAGKPPRMTELVPSLPASLDAWFARACAVGIEARFQSAQALFTAYQAAVRGEAPASERERESVPRPSAPHASDASLRGLNIATSATLPDTPRSKSSGNARWLAVGVAAVVIAGVAIGARSFGESPTPAAGITETSSTSPPPSAAASQPAAAPTTPPSTSPSLATSDPPAQPAPPASTHASHRGAPLALTAKPSAGASTKPIAAAVVDAGTGPVSSVKPPTHFNDIE